MIGQTALFAPEAELPLKRRVEVALVPSCVARHVLETYHYLHRARTGCQLHYSVSVDGVIDGVISYAFPMTSQPICGIPADELIEFARMYLHRNIPHTATCAIGKTLVRVKQDWQMTNPAQKPIHMVVSWSDTVHHIGTVYKASNFIWLKRSTHSGIGRYRGVGLARTNHGDFKHAKDCWVYWLDKKERETRRQASE